jgi:hypothetical protein
MHSLCQSIKPKGNQRKNSQEIILDGTQPLLYHEENFLRFC